MFKKILLAMGLASMIVFTGAKGTTTAMAADKYLEVWQPGQVLGNVEVSVNNEASADGGYELTVSWNLNEDYRGIQAWAETFTIYGCENKFSKAFESSSKDTKTFTFYGKAGTYIYCLRTTVGFIMGEITIGNGADADYQAVIDAEIEKKISRMEEINGKDLFEASWTTNAANADKEIPAFGDVIEDYIESLDEKKSDWENENPDVEDEIEQPTDEEMQEAVEKNPEPTAVPTPEPTAVPTPEPTAVPTPEPTEAPVVTVEPTTVPEITETPAETPMPTEAPIETPIPTETPVEVPEITEIPVAPDKEMDQVDITETPVVDEPVQDNTENSPSFDGIDEDSIDVSDNKEEKVDFTVPAIIGVCFIGLVCIVVAVIFSYKKRG